MVYYNNCVNLVGTNDGGLTFANSEAKISTQVNKMGERLNLQKHIVYIDGSDVQETTLPADIGLN